MGTWRDPVADDEEWAFISALKEGDEVLLPERPHWMRIVEIEDGVTTTTKYDGRGERVIKESWRRLYVLRADLHSLELQFARPDWLDYNDIEQSVRRKRRDTGE